MADASCATPSQYHGLPGNSPVPATLGLAIQKVGRTTELTTGTITAINATFDVAYAGGTAHFVGLIVTSNKFGKYGDSGSLIVTRDAARSPVAVLFGGDPNGTGIGYPIGPVLSRFGVSICGE